MSEIKDENHAYDLEKIHDSGWQHGLSWRKKMLMTIAKLRKEGYSEMYIKHELKKAGLTNHTLNTLVEDSYYFNGDEESVFEKMLKKKPEKKPEPEIDYAEAWEKAKTEARTKPEPIKKPKKKSKTKPKKNPIDEALTEMKGKELPNKCKNCGKSIPKNRIYCNEKCVREYYEQGKHKK